MATLIYKNGQIPESLMVTFGAGWNVVDGNWKWILTAPTFQRHGDLVVRAARRTGRILKLSPGWACYRPLLAQRRIRQYWCSQGECWKAARPGTSAHGGIWEGRQSMALDYCNYLDVYLEHGGEDSFFEDCLEVGLWPGLISQARGYDYDESWHITDLKPWTFD